MGPLCRRLFLGGLVKEVVPAFFLGQNIALVVEAVKATDFSLTVGDEITAVERFVQYVHDGCARLRAGFTQYARGSFLP